MNVDKVTTLLEGEFLAAFETERAKAHAEKQQTVNSANVQHERAVKAAEAKHNNVLMRAALLQLRAQVNSELGDTENPLRP